MPASLSYYGRAERGRQIAVRIVVGLVCIVLVVGMWRAFASHRNAAPDFTLVDQDDRLFTLSQQRGRPVVVFFGYTHCPDACPTTLAHLAYALRTLKRSQDVTVAFISVDPHRDTQPIMKRYVRAFDPHFVGLIGVASQIARVEKAYHTWSQELPVHHGPNDDYTVAHGSTIYFIDRDGNLRGLGNWDDGTDTIERDLRSYFG